MTEILCTLAWDGKANEVKELLPQLSAFGVNGHSKRGQTALYCAARQGRTEVLTHLLNFEGIETSKPCSDHGGTPLHASGFHGHEEATALLLYAGANPEAKNAVGMTAKAEARTVAINPYNSLQNGGREELLRRYPILASLRQPPGASYQASQRTVVKRKEKEKEREKDSLTKKDPTKKRKKAPVVIPPSSNMTFIQNKDEVLSLHKALSTYNKGIVYFFSHTNPSAKKLLDSFVTVLPLITKTLNYYLVLVSSATFELAVPFFQEYPQIRDVYQDPSHISFEVMGLKKSVNGMQLGGCFVLNYVKPKGFQIIYQSKEKDPYDIPSLPDILGVCGATPEQIASANIGDLKVKPQKKDLEPTTATTPHLSCQLPISLEEKGHHPDALSSARSRLTRKSLSIKDFGSKLHPHERDCTPKSSARTARGAKSTSDSSETSETPHQTDSETIYFERSPNLSRATTSDGNSNHTFIPAEIDRRTETKKPSLTTVRQPKNPPLSQIPSESNSFESGQPLSAASLESPTFFDVSIFKSSFTTPPLAPPTPRADEARSEQLDSPLAAEDRITAGLLEDLDSIEALLGGLGTEEL